MCNSENLEVRTVDFSDSNFFNKVITNNFEYWDIDELGNILRKEDNYPIEHHRLLVHNWLDQIIKKNGSNAEQEFYFVFLEALERAGYKKLIIDLKDPLHSISVEK